MSRTTSEGVYTRLNSNSKSPLNSSMNISISDLSLLVNKPILNLKQDIKDFFELAHTPGFLPPELTREYLIHCGYKYPQKIISIQMLKGGVAKTTSALNLGLRAAMYGAKVLFVDLDQQANLTFALGYENENLPVWLDIFEKKKTIDECLIKINENIELVPSSLNNSVLERVMVNSNRNWSLAVKVPLEKIKLNYDLILIDTAPALSALNTAVTVASDEVIMPVNPDKFSILGFEKNRTELEEIKKDFGLKCCYKILFTKFDGREKMSAQYLQQFIEKYPDSMMKNYIRTSTDAKNMLGTNRTIFSIKSSVKEDYDLTAKEILGF